MLQSIAERSSGGDEGAGRAGAGGGGAGGGQFICTTFRPEMLHVAEKCYGVRYLCCGGGEGGGVEVCGGGEAVGVVVGRRVSLLFIGVIEFI